MIKRILTIDSGTLIKHTLFTLTLLFSTSAHSALSNSDREVLMVDIMKTRAIIWVSGQPKKWPNCKYKAPTCSNNEPYCLSIIRTALAAKLSGSKVEFDYEKKCDGDWPIIQRFRIMNK